jgi:hypothetical protein
MNHLSHNEAVCVEWTSRMRWRETRRQKKTIDRPDYTLPTGKQRLGLSETNSAAVWAQAVFAGRSNTFCASPRQRRQSQPRRPQHTDAPATSTTGLSFFTPYYTTICDTISKTVIKALSAGLKRYDNIPIFVRKCYHIDV